MHRKVIPICFIMVAAAFVVALLHFYSPARPNIGFLRDRRPIKAGTYYSYYDEKVVASVETYSWREPFYKVREAARIDLAKNGWSLTVDSRHVFDDWRGKAGTELFVEPGESFSCGKNRDVGWTTVTVQSLVPDNIMTKLKAYLSPCR